MHYFRRMAPYILTHYRAVLVSIICALLVAVLFSASLVGMLPLMKVMIGEEGLHGWVHRTMVRSRTGLVFLPAPLPREEAGVEIVTGDVPLQIQEIRYGSTAAAAPLQVQHIVVAVEIDGERLVDDRDAMLNALAAARDDAEARLTVHLPGEDQQREITLALGNQPIYAGAVRRLLSYVPPDESEAFRRNSIMLIIMVILAATLVRCVLQFAQKYIVARVSYGIITQLRQDAYATAIRMPLAHFSKEGTSDTTSRFVQDANQIMTGISTLLGKVVSEPLKIILLLAAAMQINMQMTLIVIMGAPLAGWIFSKLGRKMKRATRRNLESWSQLIGRLQDSLLGVRVVKGYHREAFEEEKFRAVNQYLLRQQYRIGKIDAAGGPILEALGISAACVGMMFAVHWMTSGRMSPSDFFTVVFLLGTVAESGRKLGDVYPRLQTANAAAERVFALVDAPKEQDAPHAQALAPLRESLEFRAVTFAYPDAGGVPALDDINLTVAAGQTVAVVGANGSGKSTLLNLIPRFYEPDRGAVLIDGQDIATVTLASLRGQIGIVTQRTITFKDTIAANIAYGDPQADPDLIVAAAKKAHAHEFIEQTTHGYKTIIGEQGVTLSGGQLQRLAIARAILRDPAILIFDEATSQIDSDSEAKIQQALAEFARHRTSFIIAHRLSTVIDADVIVVMDKGRIVAQGDHKSLLKDAPLYRQLYEMQFGAAVTGTANPS